MATGGGEFGNDEGDTLLGHTDDQDDDFEQETERTQPFQPGAASTPYHGGETIEMQTWQHEQTGLPETSYGGTSRKITDEEIRRRLDVLRDPNTGLLNDEGINKLPTVLKREEIERVKNFIKARYPNVKFGLGLNELKIESSEEKGKRGVVVIGPRGGKTKNCFGKWRRFPERILKQNLRQKRSGRSC